MALGRHGRLSALSLLALGVALVLSPWWAVSSEGRNAVARETAACRTEPDTSAFAITAVRQILTYNDSAALVEDGLPYKPQHVAIVSIEETCQSVLAGYNAHLTGADTVHRIASGFVVETGTAFGLLVPGSLQPHVPTEVSILTSMFEYVFTQVLLD